MTGLFDYLHLQRRVIALAFVALTVLGITVGLRLPAAIMPEVTFPRIKVIADSGQIPADEMLRAVTRPLEESIRRVPGVTETRSTTSRGSTEINLDCGWGSDMDLTLQRVQAQIEAARANLPPGTTIDARLMNPTLFPVFAFSMTSRTRSLSELRDLAVNVIQPELAVLPGVADIVIQSGGAIEARVTCDPSALQACGIDASVVADAIRGSNEIQSAGLVEMNHELYLGLTDPRPPDLKGLGQIPIPVAGSGTIAEVGAAAGGDPAPTVPLRNLGRISLEEAPTYVRYVAQRPGEQSVLVNLLRRPSASTIGLANAVRRWLASHSSLLSGVKVETFYDQSDIVRSSVTSVRDSLIVGALLAVIVLAMFLASLRLGLAGAIILPGSIGLTLLSLAVARQSLNMMTLGGIAAAIGLVLDDAIVVVEHLAYRGASGTSSRSAAMAEIAPSLVGSSLCTIAIFAPFMLLGGVTGAFFRVLALSMVLMLTASLILCIAAVPLLSQPRAGRAQARADNRILGRVIRYAVTHAWVAFAPPLALIAAIIPLRMSLGSGFLPQMDEGSLILDYVLPPGTSLTEADGILQRLDAEIEATPGISAWSRRTGDQLGFFITEPNMGDYVLRLKDKNRPAAEEIADDLRARVESSLPAVEIEFGQLIEDAIGDLTTSPQPIDIRIFGEDRSILEAKARDAAGIISRVAGVVDVRNGIVVSGPNLTVVPEDGAARLGLNADGMAKAVAPVLSGIDAGAIVRGGLRVWPVRVVLPGPTTPTDVRALTQIRVPVAPGRWTRLGEVASLSVDPGETEIDRDNGRTMVSVTARLSGRDMGSAMAEIQREIKRRVPLPKGMSIRYGGLWAQQQSSFRELAAVLLGAVAAVLLILLASFLSWRQALSVLLIVAASLAGAFAALHIGGATFNISSFVGAIMVVGIVSENAYFLVAEHRRNLHRGASPTEAAVAAARRRTRPVLMTTAAGIAALGPLALGLSAGSALLSPLALAVVGGFFTSAPLILLVLPALLTSTGVE